MHKADNLTTILGLLSRNLGTLISWNPLGHSRSVTGQLLLYLTTKRTGNKIRKILIWRMILVMAVVVMVVLEKQHEENAHETPDFYIYC